MPDKKRLAEWQLPPGVSPGLWDYLRSESIAASYEGYLQGSSLPDLDRGFVHLRFQRPGRVVDLGCGPGRSLLPLAKKGFACVGVDLSEAMLAAGAENAHVSEVDVQFVRANLVDLDCIRDGSFDYGLCLFSTLGMIRGRRERRLALGHAARILRSGGMFILHVHNRWSDLGRPGGIRHILRDIVYARRRDYEPGDRYMPAHQGVANLYLHLFTRREIRQDLNAAGFRIVANQPIGVSKTGKLRCPWFFGRLRAVGYLILAHRE